MSHLIITRADEVLGRVGSEKIAGVLSIEHPAATGYGEAPRLEDNGFADVPQKILSFWDSEQVVANGPDLTQVRDGLAFIMDHIGDGPVLIHCHAGKARSTAMALGALSLIYAHESENEIIDRLLAIRPQAAPNILIVEMVDQLTGRNGKLLQAVKGHPVLTAQRTIAEEHRQASLARHPERYKKLYPEKFPQPPQP